MVRVRAVLMFVFVVSVVLAVGIVVRVAGPATLTVDVLRPVTHADIFVEM